MRFHLWVVVCVCVCLWKSNAGSLPAFSGMDCSCELLSHHHTHANVFLKNTTSCVSLALFLLSCQHFTPFISVHTDQIISSYCTSADVMRIRAPVSVILINITPACFLSDQFTAKRTMLLNVNVAATIPPVLEHSLDHFGF